MDQVDETIGTEIANTAFTNRAAFYGLFAAVYDAEFEIQSPLRRKTGEPLPNSFKTRVLRASDAIVNGTAPERVLESLARRTTHKDSRTAVIEYLKTQLFRG